MLHVTCSYNCLCLSIDVKNLCRHLVSECQISAESALLMSGQYTNASWRGMLAIQYNIAQLECSYQVLMSECWWQVLMSEYSCQSECFWVLMSSFDIQLWARASDKQELMSDTDVKALMFDWSSPPMSSFLKKKIISILPEKRSLELVFCPKKKSHFCPNFSSKN